MTITLDNRVLTLIVVNCALLMIRLYASMLAIERRAMERTTRETIKHENKECDNRPDEFNPCVGCEYAGHESVCKHCEYFMK